MTMLSKNYVSASQWHWAKVWCWWKRDVIAMKAGIVTEASCYCLKPLRLRSDEACNQYTTDI